MATDGSLRRSKSIKALLSRKKSRTRVAEDEEPTTYRPAKQQFVQYHITSDDIGLRPTTIYELEAAPVTDLPIRTTPQRHRNTWPSSVRERKAGSYEFDTIPTLIRTPWELERASRRPRSQHFRAVNQRPLPRRVFEQLPREIYHSIIDQLELLHTKSSTVDAAGRQADLKSLLFVNKRWHRVAREHTYREIWLPGIDEPSRRALSLSRSKAPLRLLLRTLTDSPGLSSLVRHLRITADLAIALDNVEQSPARRGAYEVLTQIIAQCPNLESLSGYVPAISDEASVKLALSLAKCPKLKTHAWNLRMARFGRAKLRNFSPSTLVVYHGNWQALETLVLCSSYDGVLGQGTLPSILQQLPSLKHLMVSRLCRQDFHNGTLMFLPALKSLRLEHLEGLTDHGVEQLANTRAALSLTSLSLIGLELTALRVVQTLLSTMHQLKRFHLVQDTAPEIRPGMESTNIIRGLESRTLQYLHWDALVPGSATTLIANSIASGRFPALRKVKVPCDYDGAIQALCRPIEQRSLNASDLELLDRFDSGRYERFLRISQIQAQLRVRESRQQPSFNVVVQDENNRVQHTHVIGSYLGSMDSKIEYSLEPDIEDSFYALAEFHDVEAPRWVYEKKNEMERSVKGEQILDLSVLF